MIRIDNLPYTSENLSIKMFKVQHLPHCRIKDQTHVMNSTGTKETFSEISNRVSNYKSLQEKTLIATRFFVAINFKFLQ